MTKERFNELVDDIINTASTTLKTKNAKYAPANDALHNFHYGAQLDNSTTAQTIWHYMKKHMVALLDKINRDDWEDLDDAKEKIQDIINYLVFMWCAANESQMDNDIEPCNCCPEDNIEYKCTIEDRDCGCCKYLDNDGWDDALGMATNEPCKSCKHNFKQGTEEFKNATDNWEYFCENENDEICHECKDESLIECNCCKHMSECVWDENTDRYITEPCKSCKLNFVHGTEEYEKASINWEYK